MAKKNKAKSVKPKSTELYYKGKRLNKFFKGAIEKVAQIKKQDISTPKKLKDFYNSNKETFSVLFEIGIETQLQGSTTVFNQFDTAKDNEHEFFVEKDGKQISVSANEAKFQLAKTEQQLNVLLGSTGVEFSYKKKLDNTVYINLPSEEEIEELIDMPVEFINDYLSDYGIKIYASDESKKKRFNENEPKRKSYSGKVTARFKQFRKEYNREKREAAKSKTKRKKR